MSFFHRQAFIALWFLFCFVLVFFAGLGGCLRNIKAYDFVYVFLASFTLDFYFTAQHFSLNQVPIGHTCDQVKFRYYFILFIMAQFWWYRKIFSWFQTNFKFHSHKSNEVNPYKFCRHEVSYFIQICNIVFGGISYFFNLLSSNDIQCAQYYFQLKHYLLR